MSDIMIKVAHLTKDYGHEHGIFDISLEVKKGEVFGYIGTNGSGKTTTIRSMMGFIQPDAGSSTIMGMDAWSNSIAIKPYVSYVPGEIAFPGLRTGTDFLKLQAEYLGITDFTYMNKLIKLLQLDPSANLKRMSKGMKQKTALVAALMGDREILILDEPTTGLDPLMREVFLDLIREEKAKGKTIFMSSHIFEEIEGVCDKAAMIKDGHLIDIMDVHAMRHEPTKHFHVLFKNGVDRDAFMAQCDFAHCVQEKESGCNITVDIAQIKKMLVQLNCYPLTRLSEEHETLQKKFREAFKKGAAPDGK